MGWLRRRVSSACGAATQDSHAAPRLGPLYSTAAQLSNTRKCCIHFQLQKPLSAMDWSRWRDASKTAPYTRTGHGGDMQVERRPTGRDGAQRVTRHLPTWRDGCDKGMSSIRIVRSLRRIARFARRQCRQKAAGSPRGRDGDHADPHTSEEWPRIMSRRQGRRARRQPASQ